jgi:formylglycine-generating enzyme required for sulfatase activity
VSNSPFPGLRPFHRDEADIFFGRDEQVDQLLIKLGKSRFLAVVGPSGCGKSSLIHTGLLNALEAGLLADVGLHWRIATIHPGEHPMRSLATALVDNAGVWSNSLTTSSLEHTALAGSQSSAQNASTLPSSPHDNTALLLANLRRGPLGLIEALREEPLPKDQNLLIVVDQFEEIFRYREHQDRDEADAFVALLLRSVQESSVPIYIVITMRSDFLGECALFPGLPEALNDSQFLTPRPTREQRRLAIIGPAKVFGGDVEPSLVNRLLNDMGSDPDQLPVLQHALMRLWTIANSRNETPVMLKLADYESLGGWGKTLSNHADQALGELTEPQQRMAEFLFRALSGRSGQKRDTRRPITLQTVADLAQVNLDEVIPVIDVFRRSDRSFLMPPENQPLLKDTLLDISHESLIRQWQRMKDWVDSEAQSAETYRRLEQTALLYKQKRAGLLQGLDLFTVLDWEKREKPNATWASRYGQEFKLVMELIADSKRHHKLKSVGKLFLILLSAITLKFSIDIGNSPYPSSLAIRAFFIDYGLISLPEPDMVEIPAGSFLFGSPMTEKGRYKDEDQKNVTIDYKYSIGAHEVTFEEYDVFVVLINKHKGCADSHKISLPDDKGPNGIELGRGKMPVFNVSWLDAQCYAEWLAKKTGKAYRLPTEAEWEYAARAGTQTVYPWGDEVTHNDANYGTEDCCEGLVIEKDQWLYTSPVGSFSPNKWGLYDTAGNVWEWMCSDYVETYDGNEQACHNKDSEISIRSLRGGSLDNGSVGIRSARRYAFVATNQRYVVGFRVVIGPPPPPPKLDQEDNPCKNKTIVSSFPTGSKFLIPMKKIKGGCFDMGSPNTEPGRGKDETLHRICLQDYELGKYEVTQDLWQMIMGSNPSNCQGEKLPVESVSWNEVQDFIFKLNQSTGKKYRLPTEAEWEYAARAGTTTPFYTGNCIDTTQANYNGDNYTGCGKGVSKNGIDATGSYNPNGWGLYDMAGNVLEWTCSIYTENYNGSQAECDKDTTTANAAKMFANRGGDFKSDANGLRSAYRRKINADYHDINLGFRLAR